MNAMTMLLIAIAIVFGSWGTWGALLLAQDLRRAVLRWRVHRELKRK